MFNNDDISAYDAQYEAQKIAFSPIVFQVTRIMRDQGILALLYDHRKTGINLEKIRNLSPIKNYGLKILLESSLSANIIKCIEGKYFLTKVGIFLLKDEMTRINMDYTHHVNYQALFFLDESIQQEKPIGLKQFGKWDTIYPGLTSLPQKVRDSWFNFDHYYSDSAFPDIIKLIIKNGCTSILDVGGNTAKFSVYVAQHSSHINLTIFDLPEQIKVAKENVNALKLENRIKLIAGDIFCKNKLLPQGNELIWMSQFLDCFSEPNVISILEKATLSMCKNTELWIMEPLWDRQKHETSAFCIINTSPYFTTMANGYSKMFHSEDLLNCINAAGLQVLEIIDDLGICQSIIRCKLSIK